MFILVHAFESLKQPAHAPTLSSHPSYSPKKILSSHQRPKATYPSHTTRPARRRFKTCMHACPLPPQHPARNLRPLSCLSVSLSVLGQAVSPVSLPPPRWLPVCDVGRGVALLSCFSSCAFCSCSPTSLRSYLSITHPLTILLATCLPACLPACVLPRW